MHVVIFDLFGTLVEIKEQRYPYRKLLRWIQRSGALCRRSPIYKLRWKFQ
ncbi:hypothetical protein PCO31110_04208 [Pandoraea communis]|uniref:HAD family hydrolase n=1 Tax=Pandoraea communis TaxID=2508297 RepID=A0A5E4XY71_9BURK|nr:hypothetical protein LMG16407_01498 [Pandoraea apista]VVE41005.1 hypothetical protein PCO31110_04208 [Pandoraea communis]